MADAADAGEAARIGPGAVREQAVATRRRNMEGAAPPDMPVHRRRRPRRTVTRDRWGRDVRSTHRSDRTCPESRRLARLPCADGRSDPRAVARRAADRRAQRPAWALRERAEAPAGRARPRASRPQFQTDLPRLAAGGVGGQFWSVYVPSRSAGRRGRDEDARADRRAPRWCGATRTGSSWPGRPTTSSGSPPRAGWRR